MRIVNSRDVTEVKLPKGYVLNREDRKQLLCDEWAVIILKLHRHPNRINTWEAVAEIDKRWSAQQQEAMYAGRLIGGEQIHITTDLQQLCMMLCTMHRMNLGGDNEREEAS